MTEYDSLPYDSLRIGGRYISYEEYTKTMPRINIL